jgi:hypothetical protein
MNDIGCGKLFLAVTFACALFAVPVNAQRPQPPTREDERQNEARARQQRRLAPPLGLGCDADQVTSFNGRVISYERKSGRILIRIRTDGETTEEFTIRYTNEEDLSKRFLLNGARLAGGELAKIEARWRQDKRNVRATVWACFDNEWQIVRANLIDWHTGKRKPPQTL